MFECISGQGFEGQLNDGPAGPSVGFRVSPERQAIFDRVSTQCYQDLVDKGLAVGSAVEPTRDELTARYEYLRQAAACLREHGLEVEPAPSLEVFVESKGQAWVPHDSIFDSGLSSEQIDDLFRECPQ